MQVMLYEIYDYIFECADKVGGAVLQTKEI